MEEGAERGREERKRLRARISVSTKRRKGTEKIGKRGRE